MTTKTALAILISMVALAIGLGLMQGYGEPPKFTVNAAQFTAIDRGGAQGISFPCGGGPTDMQVTLETEGRPVLVSATVLIAMRDNSTIQLQSLIDGRLTDTGAAPAYISESTTTAHTTTLHATRIFSLPAGPHTFGINAACGGTTVFLGPRWLTVWELGSGRP